MQRRHLEDASARAEPPFGDFEIGHLENHAEVFEEEHQAEQRYEQLLAYEDGEHGQNAAQG